jgi:probable phosphoglycerate mutase
MARRRPGVIVEADGGARGNPGPAGYGTVISEAATGEVLLSSAEAIGVTTNNVAEYSGLVAGLRAAADLGAVEVEVRMDSKLVIEQMSGRWQIRNAALRELAARAADLVGRFEQVRFTWVPRHLNSRADALANAAMDGRGEPDVELTPAPDTAAVQQAASAAPRSWTPPGSGATRLVLVRHGETEFTAQRRYSGRGDVALTAQGLAQAAALARRLTTVVGGERDLSSPLRAASQPPRDRTRARRGAGGHRCRSDRVRLRPLGGMTFADVRRRWSRDGCLAASPAVAPPAESRSTRSPRGCA